MKSKKYVYDDDKANLKAILDLLPKNFNQDYFISEVKRIAQDLRRMEHDQNDNANPNKKQIRPDSLKKMIKKTIPGRAKKLLESLEQLPDIGKDKLNVQDKIKHPHDDDQYTSPHPDPFTTIVQVNISKLIENCTTAYSGKNQGFRNPYNTQDAFIAIAFLHSGGKLTSSEKGIFHNILYHFRVYCNVKEYNPDHVSSTHIKRIMDELGIDNVPAKEL